MKTHEHEYLTTVEVCDYLRLKERTIYELVARRAIPCSRATGKLLFPRRLIDRWVELHVEMQDGRLAAPPPIVAGSSDPLLEWALRESSVLIADDEDSMRSLVARAIAMDGHETVTAEDGADALDILTREQGAFDLLLTDIQMPVMDGIALALAAARDFPDLKILLMTGFADQRERASGLNAIVHDVVTKPFSVADIRTAVADALAARKAG